VVVQSYCSRGKKFGGVARVVAWPGWCPCTVEKLTRQADRALRDSGRCAHGHCSGEAVCFRQCPTHRRLFIVTSSTIALLYSMFEFVTVSHPNEFRERKKQATLRQHAIRKGLERSKAARVQEQGGFINVGFDSKTYQSTKRPRELVNVLTKSPSVGLLDPFDTLCNCPERLRRLMQHRKWQKVFSVIQCLLRPWSISKASGRTHILPREFWERLLSGSGVCIQRCFDRASPIPCAFTRLNIC
jgi:hypothetical protein